MEMRIPSEAGKTQQDLTFSMDRLEVNSLKFLSTISHELYYRTAQYVTKTVAYVYKSCMDKILAVYKYLVLLSPRYTAIMNLAK